MPKATVEGSVLPIETLAKQAILIEDATGAVLMAKEADMRMPTSSMSKVLTMHVVFQAMREGKLAREATLPVSVNAWKQPGSRMFVDPATEVPVADLIRGVIVQSGNDACVVLAEALAGSEEAFASMMNTHARALGMANSNFTNATGLPDPNHYSTARDLARLAQATIHDFPEDYAQYSEREFTYKNIKQGNRNPLLYRNIGADGIKTGHTEEAGYGLMASTVREGRRLILVVNGLPNMQARADESARLLDWGYRTYDLLTPARAGDVTATVPVTFGVDPSVTVTPAQTVALSLPRGVRDSVRVTPNVPQTVDSPVRQGQEIGTLIIQVPGQPDKTVALVAQRDVARLGFWQRLRVRLARLIEKK